MLTYQQIQNNIRNSEVKHFNECRSNFMQDNKDDLETMRTNIACGLPIEILSGPCAGMVLTTMYDLHTYIDKQAEYMSKSWRA